MQVYKDNQAWGELVRGYAYNTRPVKPLRKAHLHFHVSVGDKRAHDADNIIASMKPVQDALKGLIIEDDSIDNLTVEYSFDRDRPRQFTIIVTETKADLTCDILCQFCANQRVKRNTPSDG